MAIRFEHGGDIFTTDTPEEAATLRALLKQQDVERAVELAKMRLFNKLELHGGVLSTMRALIKEDVLQNPWTPDLFLRFIDRLGEPQKAALAVLVARQRVSDEDLRVTVNVSSNQALAGTLSGISKQAAALNIPARAIFSFKNFRNTAKPRGRRSTYFVSDNFRQIAHDMSWPSVDA